MAAANLAYHDADEQHGTVTTDQLATPLEVPHNKLKADILEAIGASHPYAQSVLDAGVFVEDYSKANKARERFRMYYDDAERILSRLYPESRVSKVLNTIKAKDAPHHGYSRMEQHKAGTTFESEYDVYLPISNGRRRVNSVTTLELANEMGLDHKNFLAQVEEHTAGQFKKHGMRAEVYLDAYADVYRRQYRMTYESAWFLHETLGRELKKALGRLKDTEAGADPMTEDEAEVLRMENAKARMRQAAMAGACGLV